MKRYFIGMVVQEEKTDALNRLDQYELQLAGDDHESEEEDELNETMNAGAPKSNLNDTFTMLPKQQIEEQDTSEKIPHSAT